MRSQFRRLHLELVANHLRDERPATLIYRITLLYVNEQSLVALALM